MVYAHACAALVHWCTAGHRTVFLMTAGRLCGVNWPRCRHRSTWIASLLQLCLHRLRREPSSLEVRQLCRLGGTLVVRNFWTAATYCMPQNSDFCLHRRSVCVCVRSLDWVEQVQGSVLMRAHGQQHVASCVDS